MNTPMHTSTSTEFALSQGQQLQTPVRRGMHILVTKGVVNLNGPATWVPETTFCVDQQLHEGQTHVVDQHGWLGIEATCDASFVQYEPQSAMRGVLNAMWEQAGRWLGRSEVTHHHPAH